MGSGRCRGLGYDGDAKSTTTTPTNFNLPTFKPGLVTGGLAASSAAAAGPGSSRLDAMRSAFKQQYMSQVFGFPFRLQFRVILKCKNSNNRFRNLVQEVGRRTSGGCIESW